MDYEFDPDIEFEECVNFFKNDHEKAMALCSLKELLIKELEIQNFCKHGYYPANLAIRGLAEIADQLTTDDQIRIIHAIMIPEFPQWKEDSWRYGWRRDNALRIAKDMPESLRTILENSDDAYHCKQHWLQICTLKPCYLGDGERGEAVHWSRLQSDIKQRFNATVQA